MTLMGKLMASAGMLALSTGFAAAAPAVVQNDLNLRSGPGIDFAVIAAMPAGTMVNVIGCEAGWCRVALGDTVGFASRGFLGLGGPVAAVPASGSYGVYHEGRSYGYRPGYAYGHGTPAYSERTFSNERGFGPQGTVRGERFAGRNVRGSSEVNVRGGSEQPHAAAIQGNNPMRIRQSTANPNLPRTTGQATAIKGNNPMRIRQSTASSNANATTGAAPRENNRSRGNNY
jgi:uncharacterized protein YraI